MPRVKRVGYAVVGLGSISQVAVLPAFAHSAKTKLVAVVRVETRRRPQKLAEQFNAGHAFSYDKLAECLEEPRG